MCRFSHVIFLLRLVRTLVTISVLIPTLSLLKYWAPQGHKISCNLVKQQGSQLEPIRIGLFLASAALTKKAAEVLCLLFFPPWQCFPFSVSDVGKAFQNVPVSSLFQMSSGANPLVNSLTHLLQLSTVSCLTSPSSTAIFSRVILCLCFHFASQPSVSTWPRWYVEG